MREGSWLLSAEGEEEEGDLAGTGAGTCPGLPGSKWVSRPVLFNHHGKTQTLPPVALWTLSLSRPTTHRTFLSVPKPSSSELLPHTTCSSPLSRFVLFFYLGSLLCIYLISAVKILLILQNPIQMPPLHPGGPPCSPLPSVMEPQYIFI